MVVKEVVDASPFFSSGDCFVSRSLIGRAVRAAAFHLAPELVRITTGLLSSTIYRPINQSCESLPSSLAFQLILEMDFCLTLSSFVCGQRVES